MIIKKVFIKADNIVRPLEVVKPIIGLDGEIFRDLCISESGDFYRYSEVQEKEFLSDCDNNPIAVHEDKNGRKYCGVDAIRGETRNCQVARNLIFAFEEEHHEFDWYTNMEVDHINPSIPVDNNIQNLRWVSHDDNMRAAAETGVMYKKYNIPLVNEICQMISNGISRAEIMETLGVRGSLIDDIRAGRAYKKVSEKYLDKGFSYRHEPRRPRSERVKEAHEICKLLEKGLRCCEICREVGVPSGLVTSIVNGMSYKDISSQYNISNYRKQKDKP